MKVLAPWRQYAILICFVFLFVAFGWYMPAFFLASIGGAGLWRFNKFLKEKDKNVVLTEHGSASWNSASDLLLTETPDKLGSGLYIGSGICRYKHSHLLTIAPSGAGKGTCLIIPNLLMDPFGSLVVTDPKGENAFITAKFQSNVEGRRVFIIDPWEEQKALGATHGIQTAGFNPFAFIKHNMHELRDNCEQIAMYLVPDNPEAKDPYWNDRARSLIKILLMHIITDMPESEHNFWTLYKLLRKNGNDWLGLLADLKLNQAEDGLISIAAEELIGIETAGNTMAGIKSGAQNATTIFESPQLRKSLATDDFNPYWLPDGNCTVYIVIPERFLETHSTWLRLVVGLCLKACNARPDKRVTFLLDEFPVLGRMPDIQRGYAYARGQNVALWIFAQNLSALKKIYGEDGMNGFISNASIIHSFGGQDNYTNEYFSQMLGEATYEQVSKTTDRQGQVTGLSKGVYGRRLMTPDEVGRYDGIVTFVDKLKLQLWRLPYYKSRYDFIGQENWKNLSPETYKRLKAGDKPAEHYDYFIARADPRPRNI